MKRSNNFIGLILLASIGSSQRVIAQVSPDGTVGTIVSPGPIFNITGGSRPSNGPNLFHSFSQFSLPMGSSAIFQNDPTVQTIFSRVTGGSRSDINGMIQTQGNASLFLMNPNGIVFGPNARLQLDGSFLGTTATGIKFADGIEFNTVAEMPALLSVNLPIGLQMGTRPGDIQLQGTGHLLTSANPVFTPYSVSTAPGLQVESGQSLSFVGGTITSVGSVLNASEGQIDLNAVGSNARGVTIALVHDNGKGWKTQDQGISTGTLTLSGASLLNGRGASQIQLQGGDITLQEGSLALIQNTEATAPGTITVRSTTGLRMIGMSSNNQVRSSLEQQTLSSGNTGDIVVTTPQLELINGAAILNRSFRAGQTGHIVVNAGQIQLNGFAQKTPLANSLIANLTTSTGNVGDVQIVAQNVSLDNGGTIGNFTFGPGNGGLMNVVVNQKLQINGYNPLTRTSSSISTLTTGVGKGGNGQLKSRQISLSDGGSISAPTLGKGNAGDLEVNASESIVLKGGNALVTRIAADVPLSNPTVRQLFRLPDVPSGDAGSLVINTPFLQVNDRAEVSIANNGTGKAENLTLNTGLISLRNGGVISAFTKSGSGGDIVINAAIGVLLRDNSRITATTNGTGNGGNIAVHAPVILGLGNSDIIANAINGKGGNIQINTQLLLGLKFRPMLTLNNDITASSQFGLNGNVQLNTLTINPVNAVSALPITVSDSSRQIADRCAFAQTSSFVSTGHGGIPQSPMTTQKTDRPWNDLRFNSLRASAIVQPIAENRNQPIVEATAIQRDASGSIALVAPNSITHPTSATCGMASR